jgi:cytochrome P450
VREAEASTPFEQYAWLRDESPVHLEADPAQYGLEVWVVSRYQDVREALADRRLSNDAEAYERAWSEAGVTPNRGTKDDEDVARRPKRNLLTVGHDEHARLRYLVSKEFSPRKTELLRPFTQRVADELLDELASRDTIDIQRDFANPLSIRVACELLGLPFEEIRRFAIPQHNAEDRYELRRYLFEHVRRVRPTVEPEEPQGSQPDVIRSLIAARDDHGVGLTDQEVLDMVEILLIAGEAPEAVIGNGMFVLLQHPAVFESVRARPDLVPAAAEEILRYEGGDDPYRYRIALEDVVIGAVHISAGSIVKLIIASANRDPREFEEPDRLRLDREPNPHIAFGRGVHVCLGAPLARVVCQVAISTLVRRFPTMSLAAGPDEARWETHGIESRQLSRSAVPVRLTPDRRRAT